MGQRYTHINVNPSGNTLPLPVNPAGLRPPRSLRPAKRADNYTARLSISALYLICAYSMPRLRLYAGAIWCYLLLVPLQNDVPDRVTLLPST